MNFLGQDMIESIESSNTSAFTNRGRPSMILLHHRLRQVAEYQVTDIPDGIRQHPYRRDRLPTLEAAEFSPVTNPENGFTRFYNKFGRFHMFSYVFMIIFRWKDSDAKEIDSLQTLVSPSCCAGAGHAAVGRSIQWLSAWPLPLHNATSRSAKTGRCSWAF